MAHTAPTWRSPRRHAPLDTTAQAAPPSARRVLLDGTLILQAWHRARSALQATTAPRPQILPTAVRPAHTRRPRR
eukprot:5864-Eustigmatos_ZCMA.PRE.1